MALGTTPILFQPESHLRFGLKWDDCLTHGGALAAVQVVVGRWKYNTGTWESVAEAFNAQPEVACREFRNFYSGGKRSSAHACDIDQVHIEIVRGEPAAPDRDAPEMHGPFGLQRKYNSSSVRQANTLIDPVGQVWISMFENKMLAPLMSNALADASASGNTYLVELDKETCCSEGSGQDPPCWESCAVLLRIRMRGPLVLTLQVFSHEDARLNVCGTTMGGSELILFVERTDTCGQMRGQFAFQLGIPASCLQLVLPNGTVLGRKTDSLPCQWISTFSQRETRN